MSSNTPWYKTNEFKVSLAILIIGGLGTIVNDQVTSANIFTTLVAVLKWGWNGIIFLLTFPIKVYWIIISIALIFAVLYLISRLEKKEVGTPPAFLNYTSDTLKRWKWSWSYNHTSEGYRVADLIPYCSICSHPMRYGKGYFGEINAECPKCKKWISDQKKEDNSDIQMMIEHKINTKNFPGANCGLSLQ